MRVQNLFRPILRFFASENKSRRKIYVDLDSGLKNYYWVIFGYEMAKKLIFFSKTSIKICHISEMRHSMKKTSKVKVARN